MLWIVIGKFLIEGAAAAGMRRSVAARAKKQNLEDEKSDYGHRISAELAHPLGSIAKACRLWLDSLGSMTKTGLCPA
ncbi:hypothetical protein [Mesorhizobium carmichaelinearum]|uniref:hypothetical protein n=1 Tax=Mesorhizobium carmichaelinearum TaxID=1208188 RepID=UPI00117E5413|nr:hypothetical protein [Mesorhizobium carmichaelinearum]